MQRSAPRSISSFRSIFSVAPLAYLVALGASVGCGQKDAQPGPVTPAAATSTASSPANADTANAAEAQRVGLTSIFVVHMLSDFDAFKTYFEGGAAERAKAGVKGHLLTRLDDGNVVIHLFADDVATVQNALKSPEMQKHVNRQGAPDSSLVWLTRDVDVLLPATPPTGQTYSLYLKLKVADFGALERGFRQRRSVFAEQGVIAEGLHQSAEVADLAVLHFVGTARDQLEALPRRKEFTELLAEAKVQNDVKPLLGADVSRSRSQ